MVEDDIGDFIRAISEDFSAKDLANEVFMLGQLNELLGLKNEHAKIILEAAREFKLLRGDRVSQWAAFLRTH